MTDPTRESAVTPMEEESLPVSPFSEGEAGQQPSAGGLDVKALAEQLLPMLTPGVAALVRDQLGGEVAQKVTAQSLKDRRLKVLEPLVNADPAAIAVLAEHLKTNGGDVAKAVQATQRDLALDAIVRGEVEPMAATVVGTTEPAGPKPKSEETKASELADAILSEAGIPVNDPAYLSFVSQCKQEGVNSVADWEKRLRRWTFAEVRQRAIPAGAAVNVSGGRPVLATPQKELLAKEYEAKLVDVRPGDVDALWNLKKEYRAKGLPVV